MSATPAISFVIPVYNAEKYIGQAIESLLAQSMPDWELIVADDKSTDGTLGIVDRYAAADPRIRIIHSDNRSGGAITPRTRGIKEAKADLVSPLDADDFVEPDYVSNLLKRKEESGADLVFPTMYGSTSDYQDPISKVAPRLYSEGLSGPECVKLTLPEWRIHCNGGLIPKKLYLEAFREMDSEATYPTADELLTRRLLFKARKVVMTEDRYCYRIYPGQEEKYTGKQTFTHLINSRELIKFTREKFGDDSEEYLLALRAAVYGIIAALRKMGGRNCPQEAAAYAGSLISGVKSLIEVEKIKKSVPGRYRMLLSLPSSVAADILRGSSYLKRGIACSRTKYRSVRFGMSECLKELNIFYDTLRLYSGLDSRNPLDRELDRKLYTGKRGVRQSEQEIKEGVICVLDGNMNHGGLTDRLRGILSAYKESKKKGRKFYIMWDSPFRLSDYLEPAEEDWRLERTEVARDRGVSRMVTVDDMGRKQSRLRLRAALRNPSRQIHLYTNADSGIGEYKELFRELFRPSEKLVLATQKHIRELGEGYWSASYRFIGHLGDFNDWDTLRLTAEEQEELILRALRGLDPVLKELPEGKRLLVTSDSKRFIERVAKYDGRVYVVEGDIKHVDLDEDNGGDAWLKTFVDQQLIMGAERVYRMLNPLTYVSGFPRFAAEVGGGELIDLKF